MKDIIHKFTHEVVLLTHMYNPNKTDNTKKYLRETHIACMKKNR